MTTTDKEILKASSAIDRALARMDETNRGETAVDILNVVRNLNDHVAWKIWIDVNPNPSDRISIKNVSKEFIRQPPKTHFSIFKVESRGRLYALHSTWIFYATVKGL